MQKKKLVWGVLPIIFLTIFVLGVFSGNSNVDIPEVNSEDQGVRIDGYQCQQVVRGDGTREEAECSHNILYTTGRNITRDLLGQGGVGSGLSNITVIELCNATSVDTAGVINGCGEPVALATENYTAYAACGLSAVAGEYNTLNDFPGNWTISATFTSGTCADTSLEINSTRLQNVSGIDFAGNSFTLVTLDPTAGDQLTVNWTLMVT